MSKPTPLNLQVNPSLGVPIYRQIMDQLRAQVAGGRVRPGQFVPSVRQVAQQLQVNPMTVSKAYSLLERDGLLVRVRGRGMAVATPVDDDLAQRQQLLRPLLEAALARADELNLTRRQVLEILQPLLKEMPR